MFPKLHPTTTIAGWRLQVYNYRGSRGRHYLTDEMRLFLLKATENVDRKRKAIGQIVAGPYELSHMKENHDLMRLVDRGWLVVREWSESDGQFGLPGDGIAVIAAPK